MLRRLPQTWTATWRASNALKDVGVILGDQVIDADWPHQVAVTAETCRGDGYLTTHFFCTELSLCPRHWHHRRDDRGYVVFCFADPAHAALFRKRFNGVEVDGKIR